MKNYKRLALFFGVIFLALIAVQCYYLYNTAQLWRSEIFREVRYRLDKFDMKNEGSDSKILSDDIAASQIYKLEKGEISKAEFLQEFRKNERLTTPSISEKIDKMFAKEGYEVGLEKKFNSIYSAETGKQMISAPITVFRTKNSVANGKIVSESKWETSSHNRDSDHPQDDRFYRYIISGQTDFNILNINKIIFLKLAPQVILNLLIAGLMLWLFIKSLKNLNLQNRKIAELHTTIDSISHELNTPVSTLKFSVASLQPSDFKSVLERQISRIENISGKISQRNENHTLLDFQQIEDYFKNIRAVYPEIKFEIDNGFKFNKTVSAEDFELIFDNLIGNSVKYKASKILIKNIFSDEISLKINDDGIGIPENETENIFKKYYRIPRPENLKIGGLGLGLFLVNETVKKYNGEISVQKSPENGSSFTIKIPQNQ